MTPSWRTVVLSPHFDDAALSVAALVRRLPRPLTVVTVFGGPPPEGSPVSWWDATCGFSSAAEAYACRRAEDARACALLERTDLSVDEVAADAGFGTAGSLRLHLQAELGVSPTAYRATFRGNDRSAAHR